MKVLESLSFGLLLFIVVTFSIKNAEHIRFRYFNLIDSFEIPLFLLVLLLLLLGMLAGVVIDLIVRHRLRKAIRRQLKITDELQKQLIAQRKRMFTGAEDENGEEKPA